MTGMARLRGWGIGMALSILVLDQISKWWVLEVFDLPARISVPVLSWLNLTMVWNRGITFGLLSSDSAWSALVLAAVALAVVAALAVWLWQAERMAVALALGAVAGGAVGNVIDRIRFGAVVDFVHAHAWGWSWYVFNVADAAIVCGVGLLLLDSLLAGRKEARARQGTGQMP
jgi:lipoprotein signal peptidase